MMGEVAQFHDPEGDRLIHLAESLGGPENLSEGERWRLANTLDRRRRQEAAGAQPARATDALSAQRMEAIESRLTGLKQFVDEVVLPVVGEVIGEAEQNSAAHAKKLLDELRAETGQKLNAQYDGFERAVTQLRDEDRRALFENLRETLGDAEARIDASFAKALEAEKERNTIELALTRDELLSVISEKTYAQFTDDAPKLELAEKAIASLRKRITSLEEESARQAARGDQFAGMAASLATLEDAYRQSTKSLLIRCAANHLAARKETARANELADKVGRLETKLEELTEALLARKVIR